MSPMPRVRWVSCPRFSRPSRSAYIDGIRAEYAKVAEAHARNEREKQRLPLSRARENAHKIDWSSYSVVKPQFFGTKVFETYDLEELSRYIDWTPFFQTWELKGRFPAILEDEKQGEAARQLYADAQAMLAKIIEEKWFRPRAVIGFWPANAVGDDIRLFTDEGRKEELATFFTLRQQLSKRDGRPNVALSDFVAPLDSGVADYVGGFVVTAGIEEVAIAERFERANDDYSSILVKALADRFAEAFAERMHERVRKEFWGYAPDEALAGDDLIGEAYAGIRPAPGYPAQPDHTEKKATPCGPARRFRASISAIPKAIISALPRWSGIRFSTMRAARICQSQRLSAGSGRCSTTCRPTARRKSTALRDVSRIAGTNKKARVLPALFCVFC